MTLTERWRNPMWGELFCQRWAFRIGNMRWNHITLGKILEIDLKFSIVKFIEQNLYCYSPHNFLCLLCVMLDWFYVYCSSYHWVLQVRIAMAARVGFSYLCPQGVVELYSKIADQGYTIMFLTNRWKPKLPKVFNINFKVQGYRSAWDDVRLYQVVVRGKI